MDGVHEQSTKAICHVTALDFATVRAQTQRLDDGLR